MYAATGTSGKVPIVCHCAACRAGTMLVYIYKAKKPSVCLSVMPITHLGLPILPYQLPNIIKPSSSYFKFVTASECNDQVAFYSRLKMKKWRKLEQLSIENRSTDSSMGSSTDLYSGACGSNPVGEQIFFRKPILFAYMFF